MESPGQGSSGGYTPPRVLGKAILGPKWWGAQGPPPSVPHHTVAGEHRLTPGTASLPGAEQAGEQPGHWLERVSLGNKGKAWNPCHPMRGEVGGCSALPHRNGRPECLCSLVKSVILRVLVAGKEDLGDGVRCCCSLSSGAEGGSPVCAVINSLGRKTEQIDPNCLFCVFYGQQPAMGHTKHPKLIVTECYDVNYIKRGDGGGSILLTVREGNIQLGPYFASKFTKIHL